MTEFERYIQDLKDYIESRMNVEIQHEWWNDRLCISFVGAAKEHFLTFNNINNEYTRNNWRYHPVGAVAQELMRDIKDEWVSLLMRKENV